MIALGRTEQEGMDDMGDFMEQNSIGQNFLKWRARLAKNPVVTIVQCPDKLMWYANKISQHIVIEKVDSDGLWAREPSGCINIIRFEDAT